VGADTKLRLSHLPTVERVEQRLCPRFFNWK